MSFLTERELSFVKELFRDYYQKKASSIHVPSAMEKREFGYFTFEQKVMVRHVSFKDPNELFETIKRVVPLHVYHSAAHYTYPSAPMEEKVWMGAELIFDIDADHIETPCKGVHDFSVCRDCSSILPSDSKQCRSCGGTNVGKVDWVCDTCIGSAKLEVQKLIEFLEEEFGIEHSKISVSFSGNRGFHVVVSDESVFGLDQLSRKEITDYIAGSGLDLSLHGLDFRRVKYAAPPDCTERGWRGRLARSMLELIKEIASPGVSGWLSEKIGPKDYKILLGMREQLLADFLKGGWLRSLKPKALMALAELAVKRASVAIDTVVTSDIHRLLRLPKTLNGKTGLLAVRLGLDRLEDFDPFIDAVALPTDPCRVKVLGMPRMRFMGFELGQHAGETLKLPAYLAALLMAKGIARLA